MKKLLLSSAAICGLAMAAAPAHAEGLSLDLGGYFKGYGAFVDQDTAVGSEEREFDILRTTELHATGETTLDNGLVVGFHIEGEVDNADGFEVEESYAYFSGTWGRVNFGSENGAAYLLQVDAPSADSAIDGVRQLITPTNYSLTAGTVSTVFAGLTQNAIVVNNTGTANDVYSNLTLATNGGELDLFNFDYDDDVSLYSNKLTYITPVFAGFQLGASYTPENDTSGTRSTAGVSQDNVANDYGDVIEIAARYEGQIDSVGVILGAGFTHAELEAEQVVLFTDTNSNLTYTAGTDTVLSKRDDRQSWNAGLDLDIGPFGVGVAYKHDDLGIDGYDADQDTVVVGVDYTTGPFKLGASYYNQDQELDGFLGANAGELETDRYTGGVVYTYGPGMTFRGSVSYIEHEVSNSSDVEATSVLLGTHINF